MNADILNKALKMAGNGLVPIPLRGKVPQVKGWQQLRDVTEPLVRAWYADGLLQNVGLLCGEASGNVVVLDFDGKDGYHAFCEKFPALADTYTVETGSGDGMHVYVKVTTLPASTGTIEVPGGGKLEVKANGRQVVVPPSIHPDTGAAYEVYKTVPLKTLDNLDDVLTWVQPEPRYEPTQREARPAETNATNARRYAEAALRREAQTLADTRTDRNIALNTAAFKLGALSELTREEIYGALRDACLTNGYIPDDGEAAFQATFDSGYGSGAANPRAIPAARYTPAPNPDLPGAPAYVPPARVVEDNGQIVIGGTRIIQRKSLLNDLSRRIDDDDYVMDAPPIEWPLKCMHYLRGQARVTKPGKLIGIVGSSGSGKTSALETIADAFLAAHEPVLIWSPEWDADELAERAVQRYGGPTQDELYLHEIYKYRAAHGLPADHRDLLGDKSRTSAALAMRTLNGWQDDVYYLENKLLNVKALAEALAGIRQHLDRSPRVLILDYVQLLKANEDNSDDTTMYNLLLRVKAMCGYYGMVGIVATQTRKDDAERNIAGGKFKGTTVLNTSKNSRGSKGRVRVESDPARLRILDRPHPDQTFANVDALLGSQAARWVNDDAFNLFVTLNPEYEEA